MRENDWNQPSPTIEEVLAQVNRRAPYGPIALSRPSPKLLKRTTLTDPLMHRVMGRIYTEHHASSNR